MNCVVTTTTIERKVAKMAETTNSTTISRRSTRLFIEEQNAAEAGIVGQMERESRNISEKEQEKSQKPQNRTPPTNSVEGPIIPLVDFGMDLSGLFPSAVEDMKDHGMPFQHLWQFTY